MANGHDVTNYEIWDVVADNMIFYTTEFHEIVEMMLDNQNLAKDWDIKCCLTDHREIVLIQGYG